MTDRLVAGDHSSPRDQGRMCWRRGIPQVPPTAGPLKSTSLERETKAPPVGAGQAHTPFSVAPERAIAARLASGAGLPCGSPAGGRLASCPTHTTRCSWPGSVFLGLGADFTDIPRLANGLRRPAPH